MMNPAAGGGDAASTSASASSGTVAPSACADVSTCGDLASGCLGCAIAGPCADAAQACVDDPDCAAYQVCAGGCHKHDADCASRCLEDHWNGAKDYAAVFQCAVCDHCADACTESARACEEPTSGLAAMVGGARHVP